MTQDASSAAHRAQVFAGADLFVSAGANLGDGLGEPDELCPGDVYELDPRAEALTLALAQPGAAPGPRQSRIAPGSQVGAPGDPVMLAAQLTLMAPDGETVEILLLRHRPAGRAGAATLYALPLTPIAPRTDYTLLRAGDPPEAVRLADLVCLSFLRGTRITLGTGAQVPIESLTPGARVLTRDHGTQPVRWIGATTLRARGAFAPVVIPAGTLGNIGDLIVGPHHRLFLYLRDRPEGVATAEILVQARHLVDGERIFTREGGFADFFSLVFDRHEIIYAEGIPVESLMVNEAAVARLPPPLAEAVARAVPGLSQPQHFGTEAGPETGPDTLRALTGRRRPPRTP